MKALIKSAAAIAMLAFTAPAFAGGVTVAENGDSKLKMEGLLFLNTYSDKADITTAGGTTSTKTVGLNVERAYVTLKYIFNSDWSMRVTTDMQHEANLGSKKQNIFLKYAYLEGKLAGDQAVLRIGQSHTPWIDHEESLWKHRYVENTMVDKFAFDDSSDLGLGLYGKVADGLVNYWLTETNGSGYGNGAATNGLDFNSRIGINPIEGLEVDLQFRDGYRGTKTYVANVTNSGIKSTMWQVMASYGQGDFFRVGANYLSNKDDNKTAANVFKSHGGNITSGFATIAAAGDQVKSTAWTVWGWVNFPDTDFGAFGRYDRVENKGTFGGVAAASKEKIDHYVAGVEYHPIKPVTLALVMDNTKGTGMGGTATNTRKDTRYGLYSQVAF
ncbi:MAG TPA: hypothetical protein VNI58_05150 [Mariprofundaceae bacterium]|nr:hypothetical protein [Mariprofundaceae bacterium]